MGFSNPVFSFPGHVETVVLKLRGEPGGQIESDRLLASQEDGEGLGECWRPCWKLVWSPLEGTARPGAAKVGTGF